MKVDKDRDKLCQLLFAAQTVITDYMDMTSNYEAQKLVDEIEKTLTKEYKRILK